MCSEVPAPLRKGLCQEVALQSVLAVAVWVCSDKIPLPLQTWTSSLAGLVLSPLLPELVSGWMTL